MKRLVWVLSMFALVLVLSGCGSKTTTTSSPAITELASCLTKNGATFYGTEWCPHCKDQKKLFGDALAQVNYIDCDKNSPACADGSTLVGTQSLEALAAKSWCSFAPEALVADEQQAAVQEAEVASGK